MFYRIYITKRAWQPLVCCLSQCAALHLSRIPSGSSPVTLRKPSVVHRRRIGTENLWSGSPPISGCSRTAGRGRIPTTRMLCGSSALRHLGMILSVTATSHRKCRFPPPSRPIPTNDSYSWIKYTLCALPQWLLDLPRPHSETTKTQNQPESSPSPGTRSPWPSVATGRGSS